MSVICVSLIEKTVSEMMASGDKCKSLGADLLEIRLDFLKERISISELKELSRLKSTSGLPLMLTIRPSWEGGNFNDDEERRTSLLDEGIKLNFDYIDLELNMDETRRNQLISNARKKNVKTIVSYHDFKRTPPTKQILDKIEECINAGGDIAKVAYYNNSVEDALNVLKAGLEARERNHTFSVMGMGHFGQLTRILAHYIGCEIVYTAAESKKSSGAQINTATLQEIWKILNIKRIR